MRTISQSILTLVLVGALLACAAPPPAAPVGETDVRYGRIVKIDAVQIESDDHMGLGAVIGGIAGGVIGHQFGGGTGRDVATVAGALAGGFGGAKVAQKTDRRPGQHITVKLGNGVSVGITQPSDPNLHVDDNVRIDGTGTGARVVRAGP